MTPLGVGMGALGGAAGLGALRRPGHTVPPPVYVPALDLFLVGGQSNAMGKGDSALSPTVPTDAAYEYDQSTHALRQLADPVGSVTNYTALTGSAWPAFAIAYASRTGYTPVILARARDGSAQTAAADGGNGNWDASGAEYGAATAALDEAIATLEGAGYTVRLRGVLWCQGETDATHIDDSTITKADYKAALEAMIARFRSSYGATLPFWIWQTGTKDVGDTAGFADVRAAQQEVADADAYTYMAYAEAVDFLARGWMQDLYHYTQDAYNDMGTDGGTYAALTVQQAPLASMTASVSGLAVDVDASATLNPVGTITGYDWDWGDGTAAGSGVTASHTYAAAGTYTVTLTVTNDSGQGDTTTAEVAVSSSALSGAAAWWRAADYPGSGTTLADGSGNGHDASLVGSPVFTAATPSAPAQFALGGTGQYLTVPDDPALDLGAGEDGTLVLVFTKTGDQSGNRALVAKRNSGGGNGWILYCPIRTHQVAGGVSTLDANGGTFADGALSHAAVVRRAAAGEEESYLNGVSDGPATGTSSGDLSSATALVFGNYPDLPSTLWTNYQWVGAAVFKRALTTTEMQNVADALSPTA